MKSRRSIQAILWGVGLFALFQGMLAWLIEAQWPQLRDPAYAVRIAALQRRLHATGRESPAVVVMLGSSRTANALRGQGMEATLSEKLGRPVVVQNLGVPGAGPMHELLYFGRLGRDGIRPDLLLIEVLPLFLDQATTGDRWLPAECLGRHDLALLDEYGLPAEALRAEWRRGCWLPCFTHRTTIVNETLHALLPRYRQAHWSHRCDGSGWLPQPREEFSPEAKRQALERARQEYQARLQTFHLGGPSCAALERLLRECNRQQISAALVLMPEAAAFQSWYPPAAWRAIEQFLARLSAAHNCPVINARNWIGEADFYDGHHLLNRGATAFTQQLAAEVMRSLPRTDATITCR